MGKKLLFATVLFYVVVVNDAELVWNITDDDSALCNDFTRAGFFHRQPTYTAADQKWVVFLESGSLCYSNETCNRRYFQSHLRDRYSTDVRGQNPFGNFDTAVAWAETGAAGQPLTDVVNPLMTSPYCFRNETRFFSDSDNLSVEGRDILSSDCRENPTFWSHGHVLVPYCSSDLWLGSDERQDQQCDCWDQDCFRYNPTSEDLQFTFRGQTIFRSVLQTLDRLYNLKTASEIVLVGSSAGGVGVLNSAKWVRDTFQNVSLRVITDSSWFINFQDGINRESGNLPTNTSTTNSLVAILSTNEACMDTRLGYPCCLSAQCILLERTRLTGESYFPQDVPVFALTSIYDIFLLANSLAGLDAFHDAEVSTANLAVQFISTVGEYGGAMNASLIETGIAASRMGLRFSYFTSQCFQHIYLATSSLRKEGRLLGPGRVEIVQKVAVLRHRIQSGVWNGPPLGYYDGEGYTIRDAIDYWYWNVSDKREGVAFRDECSSPHCSNSCPEEIVLVSRREAETWSVGARVTIAILVLLIAIISLMMKLYCCVWAKLLDTKQRSFLASHPQALVYGKTEEDGVQSPATLAVEHTDGNEEKGVQSPATLAVEHTDGNEEKFPKCTEEDAISVACLDLHYSVSVEENLKDRKETHQKRALKDLQDDVELRAQPNESEHLGKKFLRGIGAGRKTKKILNGISAYFNPKQLIAIMGPSGSGKTTLLDILTGRRNPQETIGKVHVNGSSLEKRRNWYISNTGYVLQLAAPYYEELTVRENLTLAAWIKLHISSREKFQRVEQVMEVTGLRKQVNTVVGGATGQGLSGGQKRRLVVALQLLKLPIVIFLDEPTSGLDSTSSAQLLDQLNYLADSNRTVVLTIHQPGLEMFHMFHKIILLSEGKVAYHGVPQKAYEVFVNALQSRLLCSGVLIPKLGDRNPADVIMDMLGDETMRGIISSHYEDCGEHGKVKTAVKALTSKEGERDLEEVDHSEPDKNTKLTKFRQYGRRIIQEITHGVDSVATMEVRAMKRANVLIISYLPIIFFFYGFLLGTVYLQTTKPFLIMSGFCVYSVASALFMFPALYPFYVRAVEIYKFEHADGAGRATDLVIQPFVRFISMAFFPVIICAGVLYLLLVESSRWDPAEFFQIALVNTALNQTWTALLIWLILTFQKKSLRLSPVLSAVAGFTSGFFIPINDIPPWYRWMSFINPNYYGFSASAVILLSDFESDCERDGGSELECYTASGDYILAAFGFNTVNPYQNILILLCMTAFFLVIAGVSNWIRYLPPQRILIQLNGIITKITERSAQAEGEEIGGLLNDDGPEEMVNRASRVLSAVDESLYLDDGEKHEVWTPPPHGSIQDDGTAPTPRVSLHELPRKDILERRKQLMKRVKATQKVLRLQSEEHERVRGPEEYLTSRERHTWQSILRDDSARATRRKLMKTMRPFHDAVSQMAKSDRELKLKTRDAVQQWKHEYMRMASNASVLDQETVQGFERAEDTAM